MEHQEGSELTVVDYDSDGVTVVELTGDLDVFSAPTLREALAGLALDGGLDIRVDLNRVVFLDSSGIGVIVSACRRVRASGGTLSVACGQGSVRTAIEVMGLADFLEVR